jgi:selenocysteine lyase/cysteine desulfurase
MSKIVNLLKRKTIGFLKEIKNLHLLGSLNTLRLPIFSFLIKNEETGLFLHHNFVTSLLNDLFGIQTRSGCQCAGPYAQYLLGIDCELAKRYENVLINDDIFSQNYHQRVKIEYTSTEILRPGFTRFSLTYFMDEDRVDFILNAIKFVANFGSRFLPFYNFNLETGEWKQKNYTVCIK